MPLPSPPEALAAAVARHRAGDLDGAEAAYRAILDTEPGHAGSLHLLGVLDHQQGRHEEAVARIGRAIELAPGRAAPLNNLGAALKALGRLDEALEAFAGAVRLDPGYADAHANLAATLQALGRDDEALPHFEGALGLDPTRVDTLYNLGCLLLRRGLHARAAGLLGRAHALAPGRVDVLNNLGNARLALGRAGEAIAAYRGALAIDPLSAEARLNLGAALADDGRAGEAARCYEEAARLRPGEARWGLRIAALCPPVFPDAAAIGRYRADLEAALDAHEGEDPRADGGDFVASAAIPPFSLAHHGEDNRRLKGKFAALYAGRFPSRCPRGVGPGTPRVGFVVTHPHEGIFLRCAGGIVARLDPGRFRPVVLGQAEGLAALRAGVGRPDAEYVALPGDFAGAAEALHAARCDLLYFWEVGTDPLNYFLPFARAAPAQCTSWGTQVTSGVPAVDHYLSSVLIEADGADAHYSEALVRLGTLPTFQARVPPPPGPPPRRGEFGLPEGRALYVCPQSPLKLHPDVDGWLAGVLRRDPGGLVVLKGGRDARASEAVRDRLRRTIPDVLARVVFLPWQTPAGYLRLLSLADAVLDTPHFGAGSTCYDIFSLGLPLVTLPGAYNVGRYARACYLKMGIADLVANTEAEYAEIAARLGTDPGYRNGVAARIAAASPRSSRTWRRSASTNGISSGPWPGGATDGPGPGNPAVSEKFSRRRHLRNPSA